VNSRRRRRSLTASVLLGAAVLATAAIGVSIAAAHSKPAKCPKPADKAWSFGVMSDTQWSSPSDGKNPNTVAVGIIRQLNDQFIAKHVKFVVQVGDIVDKQSTASLDTTAVFRQDLYNAGIGFYPLRGNHENNQASATEFLNVFPQTRNAMMNSTPSSAFGVSNPDSATQPFPMPSGSPFQVGTISASPAAPSGFGGLCYAFDYNNARFVLLDQFTPTTGASHSVLDAGQVDWMNGQLARRAKGTHAFVFAHKGIITENHTDTLFGDDPSANPTLQNAFIGDLAANGVRYFMGGHDHMHNRALVKSPNGAASVQDITLASDSYKFYIPNGTAGADPKQTNDYVYNVVKAGGTTRETPVAQELNTVGYYVYTVRGASVTVDYYCAVVNPTLTDGEYLLSATPTLTFTKRESFGYSLNGKEFQVPEGTPYTSVVDSFDGTTARILGGVNGSTATDSSGRALTKTIDTGWTPDTRCDELTSNIVRLWGLADLGTGRTDTYALSVSYDRKGHDHGLGHAGILATRGGHGWVNAVDANNGGSRHFVLGPWKAKYGLGTFGIDPSSHTAWAVVNHGGSFAVSNDIGDMMGHRH